MDTYVGHVARGVPNGWGMFITKSGEVIEGVFVDSHPHSHIRQITVDGVVYEGDFKDHKRNGKGTIIYPDGRKVTCDTWRNGLAEGAVQELDSQGKLSFKGTKNLKGDFNGNCSINQNDFTLEGSFKDGLPQGNT